MIIPVSPLEFLGAHKVPALPRIEFSAFAIEMRDSRALHDAFAPLAGERFRNEFIGQDQNPSDATIIREHRLKIDAHDFTTPTTHGVLEELGGPSSAPITFGQFWHMLSVLERQQRYMSYILNGSVVVGVGASWIYKGRQMTIKSLFIESIPVNGPHPWGAGAHILSM